MSETTFEPMDFERNSVGVLVVRVIRLKDIVKSLGCTEAFAQQVVREIRGETSPDGSTAFVLPSQLAAWAYQRAGKPAAPFPFKTVLVKDVRGTDDGLRRTAIRADVRHSRPQTSGSTSLREIRSDLRRLKSATIQPGALAVTTEQAMARLGCSRSRIFELLKEGRLTRAERVGKLTMITLASIDRLIAGIEPTSPGSSKMRGEKRRGAGGDLEAGILALRDKI